MSPKQTEKGKVKNEEEAVSIQKLSKSKLTYSSNRKKPKISSKKLPKKRSSENNAFRKCDVSSLLKTKRFSKPKLRRPKQSEPKVSESMKKASSTTANLMLNEGKFRLSTKFSTRTHYFFSADWSK